MTLEFEEQLEREFERLTLEDVNQKIMKLSPIVKKNAKESKDLDQLQVVVNIVKLFKEKKELSFKQWKYLNWYLNKNTPKSPVIFRNFNTVSK